MGEGGSTYETPQNPRWMLWILQWLIKTPRRAGSWGMPELLLSPRSQNFPRLEDVCEQRERQRRDPDGILGPEAPARALHHRHTSHAHRDHAVPRGAARRGRLALQPVLSGDTGDSQPGRTCPCPVRMEPRPAGCGCQGHAGHPRGWVWTPRTGVCVFC